MAGVVPGSVVSAAVAMPPAGAVTRLDEQLPSWQWEHTSGQGNTPGQREANRELIVSQASGGDQAIVDGSTRRIFQLVTPPGDDGCAPNIASYDIDTYQQLGSRCLGTDAWSNDPGRGSYQLSLVTPAGNSYSAFVAVDTRDHLLFFPLTGATTLTALTNRLHPSGIVAYSELTLQQVGLWYLPSGPPPLIFGLDWEPGPNRLLVATDFGSGNTGGNTGGPPPPPRGIGLTELDVAKSLAQGQGVVDWTWNVPQSTCVYRIYPNIAFAPARRAPQSPYIYLPCDTSSTPQYSPQAVIAKIELGKTLDTAGIPLQDQGEVGVCPCPDGKLTTTTPPYPASRDFLFDAATERGFMPYQVAATSGDSWVLESYDGLLQPPDFIGVSNAEAHGFALDPTTGRIYAAGAGGILVIDGRRTPLAPGSRTAGSGGTMDQKETFAVIPPTTAHPYTRLLVPYKAVSCLPSAAGICPLESFSVYADRFTLTSDPPLNRVDQNTYNGQVPAGSSVSVNYAGGARGYGFHSMVVGAAAGVLYNTSQGTSGNLYVQFPLGDGTRDLLGGEVVRTNLAGSRTAGVATALGDGNGSTVQGYAQCTSGGGVVGCAEEPISCSQLGVAPNPVGSTAQGACQQLPSSCPEVGPSPTPNPDPSASPTASSDPCQSTQNWVYPDATCNAPGTASDSKSEPVITEAGTSLSPAGIPGLSLAQAGVWCGVKQSETGVSGSVLGGRPGDGSASGRALIQGFGVSSPGGPGVSIGPAEADSWVSPPSTATTGVLSHSEASARAIDLDLGPTVGRLDIGEVTQWGAATAAGRAGTAKAERHVLVSNVTITQPDGQGGTRTTRLCTTGDSGGSPPVDCQDNLETLRQQINGAFGHYLQVEFPEAEPFFLAGSPGGYEAQVESKLTQQYGDNQFNAMGDTEAQLLPAMRLILYYTPPCGTCFQQEVSRQIVDLAGVEADAEYGINVLPPAPPIDQGGGDQSGSGSQGGGSYTTFFPGGGGSGGGGGGTFGGLPRILPPALGAVVERFFKGFGTLTRSPGDAIQMLAFLALLGLPVALMVRRRRWLERATG